jgi:hypothetical protein
MQKKERRARDRKRKKERGNVVCTGEEYEQRQEAVMLIPTGLTH